MSGSTRQLKDAHTIGNTTTYGTAKLAAEGGTTAGTVVQGNDTRLLAAANLAAHLANATGAHAASAITVTTGGGIVGNDVQEVLEALVGNQGVGQATHAATVKAVPADGDEMPLVDSAASWLLKKFTWANLKAAAKTYFDTLYAVVGHVHTANTVGFTPTGSIAATDVQAAIVEVATEAGVGMDTEAVQDIVGAMIVSGGGTYNDAAGTVTLPAGMSDPMTTRGDLIVRGASAATRLALGTAGLALVSDGTDPVWEPLYATLPFLIDGGGVAITPGIKGDIPVYDDCTIVSATALADQPGNVVVDIWRDSYTNYPPLDADSITASAPVAISGAAKSQDATLTGWTVNLNAGDTLRFNVDSADTLTRVTIALRVRRR